MSEILPIPIPDHLGRLFFLSRAWSSQSYVLNSPIKSEPTKALTSIKAKARVLSLPPPQGPTVLRDFQVM